MATTSTTLEPGNTSSAHAASQAPILVWLPALTPEAAATSLSAVEAALAGHNVLLASPEAAPAQLPAGMQWISSRAPSTPQGWVLRASDYLEAAQLAEEHEASRVLMIGSHSTWITPAAVRAFLEDSAEADLTVPRPPAGADEALVSAALLYPLTRSLFTAEIHYPLPTDAVLSAGFARRIGQAAQRSMNAPSDGLIWPVSEAVVANCTVREVALESYTLPHPPEETFQTLFTAVAGSLFADIEAKAAFWQRARGFSAASPSASGPAPTAAIEVSADVRALIDNFRLAYKNLSELWSLVLPPQTLLALKRLSLAPAETFSLSPQVWARIVYDFALAYRLRSINRGHLLGALTPLYLGWVASHERATEAEPAAATRLLHETAAAFEAERSYMVSRWRWPDRFNP